MSQEPAADPLADAVLAARLFALAPQRFGGLVLRGDSPARAALVAALGAALPLRRLPGHVDDARLIGGIDLAASLAAGRPVEAAGLIAEAAGGALVAGMAERMEGAVAGRLAQARDAGKAALVLLDDSADPEEAPPACLTERLAFSCNLAAVRAWEALTLPPPPGSLAAVAPLTAEDRAALAAAAAALGVESLRALLFAEAAALGLAALEGRELAGRADLAAAVRLVLAPRATRLPPAEAPEAPPEPPEPPPPDGAPEEQAESEAAQPPEPELADMLIDAARAAIPADLLARLAAGAAPRRAAGSGTGQKRKGALRGKPLGVRPGLPRGGQRLTLIDSLRAAVPWQRLRRAETGAPTDGPILMRKADLRVRRFEERAARVTIFVVDASGSAAAARLADAKGAVELLLAQAYVTRSQVALVAFRGTGAEVLLPPTRSLTRARRLLAALPGGGGTPLAQGLAAARELAEAVTARGHSAALVILTDGRANIAADGTPGRVQARADAEAAARAIAARAIEALVIDISARPGPEGAALAEALGGRFLALPRADARMLKAAINAAQPIGAAA
ncbi:magnesium chelatase subunit D [Erythrobacter cryptus]|uniref:magnesium chelatase subunit D n=1 Tax=Erythrobacter cryptus TaxID=196588 RepID=UPI0003FA1D8D|nr:magnesium chelatase subunit D [Erythrobacter cryptus]